MSSPTPICSTITGSAIPRVARAALALIDGLNATDARSVNFSTFSDRPEAAAARQPSLIRLAVEPPFLAMTLALIAAALLAGLHGAVRFGQPRREERAIALGKAALVENSAGLIRLARREARLGAAYADVVRRRHRPRGRRPACAERRGARRLSRPAVERRRPQILEPGERRRLGPRPPRAGRRRAALSFMEEGHHPVNATDVKALADGIRRDVAKAIIGQDEAVELMLIALLSSGHILLEGPPGTAKTFLAQCFARVLGLDFGRIQFTPDLMPGDIIGLEPVQLPDQPVHPDPRARLLRIAARRRDQPHPAQDPGGPAGGDAGARRHHRRRDPPPAPTISW